MLLYHDIINRCQKLLADRLSFLPLFQNVNEINHKRRTNFKSIQQWTTLEILITCLLHIFIAPPLRGEFASVICSAASNQAYYRFVKPERHRCGTKNSNNVWIYSPWFMTVPRKLPSCQPARIRLWKYCFAPFPGGVFFTLFFFHLLNVLSFMQLWYVK